MRNPNGTPVSAEVAAELVRQKVRQVHQQQSEHRKIQYQAERKAADPVEQARQRAIKRSETGAG